MNILVIGPNLPAPVKTDVKINDFQFIIADRHEKQFNDVKYSFLYNVTYSNQLLSYFNVKWKRFYKLKLKKKYRYGSKNVYVIPSFQFRGDRAIRVLLQKFTFWRNKKRIRNIIENNKIDILYSQSASWSAFLTYFIAKKFGLPYFIASRDLPKHSSNGLESLILSRANGIICLGKKQLEFMRQFNKKSYLIPHGLDQQFLDLRREYKVDITEPIKIVSLSSLIPLKNIERVIYALEQIQTGFEYHIYGDGPERERLMEIATKMGIKSSIAFKGQISYDMVPVVLGRYDILVMPSYPETFGRVFIEAMACGLPIIGAKGSGIDGYIVNGEEGFLVNHTNINEIQNAIQYFIEDKTRIEMMGKKAKKLSSNFDWKVIVKQYDEIFKDSIE